MAHPNALNAKLGHAASIGGAAYVERAALSDEVMGKLISMDAPARKKALAIVSQHLEKVRSAPQKPKPPAPRGRVKVRWDDQLIARLKREVVWCKDNVALARKLGLPEHCAEGVRLARHRHCQPAHATRRASTRPQIESPAGVLKQAA